MAFKPVRAMISLTKIRELDLATPAIAGRRGI